MPKALAVHHGRHLPSGGYRVASKIIVRADGRGVVGHAGARLFADVAEVTGLTAACR